MAWWSTTSRSNRESQEVVRLTTVNLTVTQSDLPVVLGFGWPIQVNWAGYMYFSVTVMFFNRIHQPNTEHLRVEVASGESAIEFIVPPHNITYLLHIHTQIQIQIAPWLSFQV